MKTLVVYFSSTGNTKKVADKIAKILKADTDEIIDKSGKAQEAVMKKGLYDITFKKDPSKYDMVVIGTPVWAFNIAPPTKSYLSQNKFKKVAFFCTYAICTGFSFAKMKKLSKKPVAKLKVHMKKIDVSDDKINAFCKKARD